MKYAALCLVLVTACAAAPGDAPAPSGRTALGLDYVTYPYLLDALKAQRPNLLSGRGGSPPAVILNDGVMPVPIETLALIPTRAVTKLERRMSDVTQIGNVATLRVTFIVGPLSEDGAMLNDCDLLKLKGLVSEPHHREYMRRCYLHEDT